MRRAAASIAAIVMAAGCARSTPQTPQAPSRDVVALAADPETGEVGRLTVTTPAGRVELSERHASTIVVDGAAPTPAATMSDAEVEKVFGASILVHAPPAVRFLLYFELGGDTLTPQSKAQLPDVTAAVGRRVAPDVSVIGHTDTTGGTAVNATLGLRRATLIRDQLLQAGLEASLIDVVSHGESDPVVPTADNVAEPRNRRVEVIVR